MKKWMIIEILVLVIVLAIAVWICFAPSGQAEPANSDHLQTQPAPETAQPTETTEPEPTWWRYPADRTPTAKQAFVYDCQAEEFMHITGESENDRVYPASITKLFTAYVALQYLQPEDEIEAGDALDLVGVGSSVAEIQKGDKLTAEQLVEAMLLPSGNDAACILAVEVGRKLADNPQMSASRAMQKFMDEVNRQAKANGMTGTHFTNPDGYHDSDHYTTHKDLVTIAKLALDTPAVMKYAVVPSEKITLGGKEVQWKNTNQLVVPESEYYCAYATGLKTGQTPSAGSCLLSSFDIKGHKYIIGVFGCPDIEDRFMDTLQHLDQALGR